MLSLVAQRRLTLALFVATAVSTLAWLVWYAWRSPQSRFLPPDGAAEWILYPVPAMTSAVVTKDVAGRYEERSVFRRTFDVAVVPPSAKLQVRAFGVCSIFLNDQPIELPAVERWNQVRTADVGGHLRPGSNDLRAIVTNDAGPPGLWLSLEGPDWSVESDDQWLVSVDGATECRAHRASQPLPLRRGNPAWGGNQTPASFQACLPVLLIFAFLSAGIVLLMRVTARQQLSLRLFGYQVSPMAAWLIVAAGLWLVLFAHNTLAVPPFPLGFDAQYHLQYIAYIQQHKALPLADQGWEMHHPPLYYLVSAGLVGICGLTVADPGALVVLRIVGLTCGVGELALVAGCLGLLFPGQPRRQLAGLGLAAFLPVHIYNSYYITNESLLVLLGTAAIYLCLRILGEEQSPAWRHILLGLCLGGALLSKVTAIVVVGTVPLVLAGRLLARRERDLRAWLGVGTTLLVTLVVSGWHYARVWAHFGTPVVGNYDVASGFRFWEDPGYGTANYLFRFGRSLTAPFYSAIYGLSDGLYSTCWGDGLCGGVGLWNGRPPWNYDLMVAGYLLALVPSLAMAIGLCLALIRLLRRPQAEWFLLLGIVGGLAVGLLYQFVRYPYLGHARANYHLLGLVAFAALAALGIDWLSRLGRVPAVLLAILLGTWACTAYTEFWIRSDSAATQNWVGEQLQRMKYARETTLGSPLQRTKGSGDPEISFQKALEADPHFVPARLNQVRLLLSSRQLAEARPLMEEVLRDDPENPDSLFLMAIVCDAQGQVNDALSFARQASQLAPDHQQVYSFLGTILMRQHQDEEAMAAYREAIRVLPHHAALEHANLGILLARNSRFTEAVAHYRLAVRFRPDHAGWLADLAWILATQPKPSGQDTEEAMRLAREACALTQFRDAHSLQALAAAQAATGRYLEATITVRRARDVAIATKQKDLAEHIQKQIQSYENKKPFATKEPLRSTPYAPGSSRSP